MFAANAISHERDHALSSSSLNNDGDNVVVDNNSAASSLVNVDFDFYDSNPN